jgi:hypothetical protein
MASQPPSDAPVQSISPNYNWQRFWIARTDTVDLSDGGFFTDPTNPLLHSHATALPLTELADYPALVLLGEPGIGKSTALKVEAHRVATNAAASNTISIHVDLRAYSSELLLHKRVFKVRSSSRGRRAPLTSSFI